MVRSNEAAGARVAGWAIGLGAAAVLVGHGITYALVHPDGHERAGILASTGHAYLHLLDGPGLVLAIASVFAAASVGFGRHGDAPDRGTLFRRLATFQLAAFVAMEVAERVGSGSYGAGTGDLTVLVVGVAVQLVLALAGASLLRALHRGGERLSTALGRARRVFPPVIVGAAPEVSRLVPVGVAAPRPARGPPAGRP
jgi:hypothetical protein